MFLLTCWRGPSGWALGRGTCPQGRSGYCSPVDPEAQYMYTINTFRGHAQTTYVRVCEVSNPNSIYLEVGCSFLKHIGYVRQHFITEMFGIFQ